MGTNVVEVLFFRSSFKNKKSTFDTFPGKNLVMNEVQRFNPSTVMNI